MSPHPEPPPAHDLFVQDWWLDAVTDGSWDEVSVSGRAGSAARLPFVRRRRFGLTVLSQPPLTPTLGPRLDGLPDKRERRIGTEHALMTALIDELPRHDIFQQSFAPSMSNWLAFHWAGFSATVRYTYRLDDLDDLDRVWAGLTDDHRNLIRRAQDSLEVTSRIDVARLHDVASRTLAAKGVRPPWDLGLFTRVLEAASKRNACAILAANDSAGKTHAAALLVWDDHWVYYLVGGRDLDHGSPGALRLLQWEAIKLAAERQRGFDFEGSMVPEIERVFRGFGAAQVPYLQVYRTSKRARPLWALRNSRLTRR